TPASRPATPASASPAASSPSCRSGGSRDVLARLRWKGGPLWRMSPGRACGPASSLISPKRTTFPAAPRSQAGGSRLLLSQGALLQVGGVAGAAVGEGDRHAV